MVNTIRGEAALVVGAKRYTLLLTLGALAEIESGLGLANLGEIGPRLRQARADDLAVIAAALLNGGGEDMTPTEVMALPVELSALLAAIGAAFQHASLKAGGGDSSGPFVGTPSLPSG